MPLPNGYDMNVNIDGKNFMAQICFITNDYFFKVEEIQEYFNMITLYNIIFFS